MYIEESKKYVSLYTYVRIKKMQKKKKSQNAYMNRQNYVSLHLKNYTYIYIYIIAKKNTLFLPYLTITLDINHVSQA